MKNSSGTKLEREKKKNESTNPHGVNDYEVIISWLGGHLVISSIMSVTAR